jgi:hypothetical protein
VLGSIAAGLARFMGADCHQKWQKDKTVPSWRVGIDRVSVGYPRAANGMSLD